MSRVAQFDSESLPGSSLYTFIDEPREFALYFLEAQRLIHDLALIHTIQGPGFAYFRDVLLSVQPMIALLKHGEQIGFYIDSNEPYFRLKIETGHHGETRSMLLPEEFREFPREMRGAVRLLKLFPNNRPPYQSVIEADGLALRDLINRVLDISYQVNSTVVVSENSDQSLMLHQLPPLNEKEYEFSRESLRTRRAGIRADVDRIFERALNGPAEIEQAFAGIGFRLLARREVSFHCSCSHQRMLENLQPIYLKDPSDLFDAAQTRLDITCEYCKSRYVVLRDELERRGAAI
jgi:molecular chaperone Hsp33